VTVRWTGCTMTSSTCRTNPQHNETIDVFYIKICALIGVLIKLLYEIHGAAIKIG